MAQHAVEQQAETWPPAPNALTAPLGAGRGTGAVWVRTLAFFCAWSALYAGYVSLERLAQRAHDLAQVAQGKLSMPPQDPGEIDPYLMTGVMLTLIGVVAAGPLLTLAYGACAALAGRLPGARRTSWALPLGSGAVLGGTVLCVWLRVTTEFGFAVGTAGVCLLSVVLAEGVYRWWRRRA